MNKKYIRLTVLFFAFAFYFHTALYAGNNGKVVRVGWFESACFQEGMTDDAEKSGYSYEYLSRIADYTDWKYEYVYGEWAELLEKLETGEIDLLAGVSKTEERAKYMLYPKYAMGTDTYYLYQHSDNKVLDYRNPNSFAGKKLGGVTNNRMTFYLNQWLKDNFIKTEIIYYDGFTDRDQDFRDNKIDGLVATDNNIKPNMGYAPVVKVGEELYYLAVAKDRKDLLMELDDVLYTLNIINPNYLGTLQIQSYGNTLTSSSLTIEEDEWISNHKELRVGYIKDYYPLCGDDADGNARGVITDITKAVISNMKLEDRVQVRYVGFDNFQEMADGLNTNKIDCSFPVISERRYLSQMNIAGTFDLITIPFMVAYKDSFTEHTFDVIAINTRPIRVITDSYPNSEIMQVRTIRDCLESILKDKATCSVVSSYRLKDVLNDSKYRNIKTMPFSASINYCIGINKESRELMSILNKGISFIEKSALVDSAYKYIQQGAKYTLSDFIRDHLLLVFLFVFIFFVVIFVIFILYFSVTRKSRSLLERHLDEVNKYNAALLSDCVYFYEFDLTKGNIVNNFISRQGYDPLYNLKLDFPMPYDEFNKIRTRELEVVASNEEEAAYWTCEGLIKAFNEGKYSVNIRCKSELLDLHCLVTIILTEEVKGHHLHAVYICKNVTDIIKEEQKAKEKLEKALVAAEQASNAKTMFLSNMSHDIRTPMNAILGFTDLMEKEKENSTAISLYLQKLKNSGKYLLSIINNILDMARIESGNTPIELTCMDIREAADFARNSFEDQAKEKKQELIINGKIQHRYILIDAAKHEQVVMNLLSNAIKYTPEGGRICVNLEELPGTKEGYSNYVLKISDNGIGMSPDFLEHIFDFFSRERNTTESKIAGTGLGMSIVKKLVDLMGGVIEIKSEPGRGTEITVRCEYKIIENPEIYLTKEDQVDMSSFEGKKVLLVEDNEFNAEIAMAILEDFGLKIDHACDGIKCIEMLRKQDDYDLVLMDIQMPKMNGYDTTKQIRQFDNEKIRNIPIIALTANAFDEDRKKAYEAGMNGHLSKPIMVKELKEILSRYLK